MTMTRDSLKKLVTAPVTWASAAVTFVAGVLGFLDPLFQIVGQTAGIWFPGVSVFATVINPRLGIVPSRMANGILLLGAVLYLGYLGKRLADKTENYLENRRSQ